MNSIIEKKCKVVMLPTNEKAILHLSNGGKLTDNHHTRGDSGKGDSDWKSQHLYILSNEKIEEDDWCYDEYNKIIFQNKSIGTPGMSKKIIATTDTSLKIIYIGIYPMYENLPQPSQQFITNFIEKYNKGQIISDVSVLYECLQSSGIDIIDFSKGTPQKVYSTPKTCIESKLKIDKNNTITIKRLKDSWNRDEVIGLIKDAMITGVNIRDKNLVFNDVRDKWISNNL